MSHVIDPLLNAEARSHALLQGNDEARVGSDKENLGFSLPLLSLFLLRERGRRSPKLDIIIISLTFFLIFKK